MGGSGRGGTRRCGRAGWDRAGLDAGGRSAQEITVFLAPQSMEDNCPERLVGSTTKRNPS